MNRPQGDGWWQASDGKWYPPESRLTAPPPPAPRSLMKPWAMAGVGLITVAWVAFVAILVSVDLPTVERRYTTQKISNEAMGSLLVTMFASGVVGLSILVFAWRRIDRSNGWLLGGKLVKAGLVAALAGIAMTIGLLFAGGNT